MAIRHEDPKPLARVMILAACAAAVALATPTARADAFVPAGTAMHQRCAHTATLLGDGRVLLVGGTFLPPSAEIFDPATQRFAFAATPAFPRYQHAAVRLPSGEVLVVGGTDGRGTAYAATELYDPRNDRWRMAAPMPVGHVGPVAVLLTTGKVLVVGSGLAMTALYDPVADAWSLGDSMTQPRTDPLVALLPDGRVLAAGGYLAGVRLASSEIYDPATNAWTPAGDLTDPGREGQPAVLPDGRPLLAGGSRPVGPPFGLATAEAFDPGTRRWGNVASLNDGRGLGARLTRLGTGRVLLLGGVDASGNPRADTEVYDPAANAWTRGASMAAPRQGGMVVTLPDGRALVTGGFSRWGGPCLAAAEFYLPDALPVDVPVLATPLALASLSVLVAFAALWQRRRQS